MSPYLGLVLAYLAGSIPAAYIAGKLTRGIDLRQHGSGNLGATNVYRVLGAKVAVAVLLFDAAKGAIPVLWFPRLLTPAPVDSYEATLWAIAFGNHNATSDPNSLYLTAGLNDEADGLFARITATPEPGSLVLLATGLGVLLVGVKRRTKA